MSLTEQKKPINDEFSIQEIFDSILLILRHLRRNLLAFSLCIILGFLLVTLYQWRKDVLYTANLKCMLSDDIGGQLSGISGVLGQLGIPVPSGKYNIDKLLEIARSRKIIEAVLFHEATIDDSQALLANHIIDAYDLNKQWSSSNPDLKNFRYNHGDIENFGPAENMALLKLYRLIVGSENDRSESLLVLDYGKTDYLMSFRMSSPNPELSVQFVNILYDELSAFYDRASNEKQYITFNHILQKKDSIQNRLSFLEMKSAGNRDRSLGMVGSQLSAEQSEIATQIFILRSALAKAEENLMIAEFTLKNRSSLIQLIDRPILPLSADSTNYRKLFLYAFLIGLLFYILYLSAARLKQISKNR